jgi:hypothetical protein
MPQPIDPHTEVSRLTAMERMQQLADRANLAYQARQSNDLAEQQLRAEQQVGQLQQKSEEVEQDLRRRNPYLGKRKRRDKGPEDEHSHIFYAANERAQVFEDPEDHKLDITI